MHPRRMTKDVETIAVLGAGDMGHGIAELCGLAGYTVQIRDIEQDLVDNALEQVEWSLGKLADRGEITEDQAEAAFGNISGTTDLVEAVGDVDLVIEAIPEDLNLKQKVFAEVEDASPDDAILASNTSTMSITEIGEKLQDPSRIVGMHFFNPVLLMDLIEIIPGDQTSDEVVATIEEVSQQVGKTTVTLDKDSPGFVTSRLIGTWMGTAFMLYEAGLHEKEAIDATMKFRAGFPMGPFELADYTGLDIAVHTGTYLRERLGDAYATSQVVQDLVDQGHLGKKSGQGFYGWEDGKLKTELKPGMGEAFDPARINAVVANEAAKLLEEGVASAEDIDLAMRNGCAFPKGPLEWADDVGLDKVLETLETLREEAEAQDHDATILAPAKPLTRRVEAGQLGRSTGQGFHTYETQDEAPTSYETIDVEVDEDAMVATVTLDRPHRLNAINDQLIADLQRGFDEIEDDDRVRVILLTATGEKAFCVGADLTDVEGFSPTIAHELVRRGHKLCIQMEQMRTPIVAAVNGYAFGGGLELTLACDLRVAAQRAKFALPEVTLGLVPGMGGTQRLPKLIGLSAAKEFAMLGDRIDADRCYDLGLVHRVYGNDTFRDEAFEFAAELAQGSAPLALKHIKALTNGAHQMDIQAGMEAEAGAFGILSSTEDVIEGVSAMFMKRDPEFQGG